MNNEKQIDMYFKDSNESQEILDLITKAKEGSDYAFEKLFDQYKQLFEGKFIQGKLKFNFHINYHDKQDIYSTLYLIFVESVREYDPSKSKFITYLTNRIFWKFRTYYLRERLIPISNSKPSDEMLDLISKTQCLFMEEFKDTIPENTINELVTFTLGGEKYELPTKVFIQHYILDKIDKVVSEKYREIYKLYIQCIVDNESFSLTKVAKHYGILTGSVHYRINKANKQLTKNLGLENVKFTRR